MYTMGREREKALLASDQHCQSDLQTHTSIIDAYHDWHDRQCSACDCLDRVFVALGEKPTKAILETAGYWYRRAVSDEPAFKDYIHRLGAHPSPLARVYAGGEMQEPNDAGEVALFEALANDPAKRVRTSVLGFAEMGRWLSVLPLLESAAALKRDDPERVAEVMQMISHGYREADGVVLHYIGSGPGGAGGLGGTESERAEEAVRIFSRVGNEEQAYRRQHGRWPNRPPPGSDILKTLENWSPLQDA